MRSGKTKQAAIYARVSTTEQGKDGTSLDTQLARCQNYVEATGWQTVGQYIDDGVSGVKESRPGLDPLMAACRAGQVDVVVVAKLDRFSRSLKHLVNAVAELESLGVAFVSVTESLDSSTPSGRLLRSQLGAFAEFERERIVERMVEGLRHTAQGGGWPGGPPPYGYRLAPAPNGSKHKALVVHQEEADVLRLVADLIVNQGCSTYSAAAHINALGIRTRRGSLWRHPNLSWQLRQPHLTGTWTYRQGGEAIDVAIPAIMSKDHWTKLQGAIKGKPRPQRKNRVYPLTGRQRVHLRCDCGGNFFGKTDTSKKGRSYYQCSRDDLTFGEHRCGHRPRIIRAPELERLVWDEVHAVLSNPEYLLSLAHEYLTTTDDDTRGDGDLRKVEQRLGDNRKQQTRIVRKLAEEDGLDALSDALEELKAEESALRRQLDEMAQVNRVRLHGATVEEQVRSLAKAAQSRLANPTPEVMAEVFDLLQLDLVRVDGNRFEGTGSIPIPEGGGEVWEGGPQRPEPPRPRSSRGAWPG